MSDEKYAEMMKEFVGSMERNDIDKALSFCTEDITFVSPYGTFKGKGKSETLPGMDVRYFKRH